MPAKYELEHVEDPENGDVRIVQVESRPELTKYARELAFKLCARIDHLTEAVQNIEKLNAGKDCDIKWICNQALQGDTQ